MRSPVFNSDGVRICPQGHLIAGDNKSPSGFLADNSVKFKCRICKNSGVLCSQFGPNAIEHRNKQMRAQRGRCAICRKSMVKPHQDHDHGCCPNLVNENGHNRIKACGKCLRGLLCFDCNRKLELVENQKWLRSAKRYLAKWSKKSR